MTPLTKDTRVKTRIGLDAVVLADDVAGDKPLVGYIRLNDGEILAAAWHVGGEFCQKGEQGGNDLIPVDPSDMTFHGIDAEELAELIWEGMDNAHDMDVTFRDYAKAAAQNVLKHLGKPA